MNQNEQQPERTANRKRKEWYDRKGAEGDLSYGWRKVSFDCCIMFERFKFCSNEFAKHGLLGKWVLIYNTFEQFSKRISVLDAETQNFLFYVELTRENYEQQLKELKSPLLRGKHFKIGYAADCKKCDKLTYNHRIFATEIKCDKCGEIIATHTKNDKYGTDGK